MLYKDFCKIIKLLKECVNTQDNCVKILRSDIFEEHNKYIMITV